MSNEQTPEDKELIKKIDCMITQLKVFGQSLWELREHASLVLPDVTPDQPDNEVEEKEEYYKCLFGNGDYATEGLIYKQSGDPDFVIGNSGNWAYLKVGEWEKSTREAYEKQQNTAQTTPVNGEWSIGKWCSTNKGCGTIKSIDHTIKGEETAIVDYHNGEKDGLVLLRFLNPATEIEVETWLTRIAEKKYPVGTKIKELDTEVEYTVTHEGIRYSEFLNNLTFCCPKEEWGKGHSNPTIWKNGKWAEILPEITTPKEVEQKERWLPTMQDAYWVVNAELVPVQFAFINNALDQKLIAAGNCFKTHEAATKAAKLIRETLKNI